MKNIHLVIQYGCDDRRTMVSNTIAASSDYFESIIIVNSGPTQFVDYFRETYPHVIIYDMPFFYGDMEPCRRAMTTLVPKSDWFLQLDADESPSPLMLENLDSIIDQLEAEDKNCSRFPWCDHSNLVDGTFAWRGSHQMNDYPKKWEDINRIGGYFCGKRLIKNTGNWTISTNFGMHEEFISPDERGGYFGYPVIHKKSTLQFAQSLILSSYSMPCVHINPSEQHLFFQTDEYKRLVEFKKNTGVKTSNDLVIKLKVERDEEFKLKLIDLLESYKSSTQYPFSGFSSFLDIGLNLETPAHYCGKDCCKYKNVQF